MTLFKSTPSVTALIVGLIFTPLAQAGWQTDFPAQSAVQANDAEAELVLPATPGKLTQYFERDGMRFFIDTDSLVLTSDQIVRYTLVAVSASGARNVSFEGMRCADYSRKIYALGHSDGSWSPSRRNQWSAIGDNLVSQQHLMLARDYFCQGNTVAGKQDDLRRRLQQHGKMQTFM